MVIVLPASCVIVPAVIRLSAEKELGATTSFTTIPPVLVFPPTFSIGVEKLFNSVLESRKTPGASAADENSMTVPAVAG